MTEYHKLVEFPYSAFCCERYISNETILDVIVSDEINEKFTLTKLTKQPIIQLQVFVIRSVSSTTSLTRGPMSITSEK